MSVSALHIENPFPGLRPYDRDQCDLFFGREEQVDELLERIEVRRLVAVVGTSGSGKSSLVRAGLVAALHRGFIAGAGSIWRTIVMRPGSEPVKELAQRFAQEFGLSREAVFAAVDRSSMGLAEFVRQNTPAGQNLLLVVDQFEEIFRYSRAGPASVSASDEAAAFVKLLLSAVGRSDVPVAGLSDLPIYIVVTMRSDFLGKCAQFRGLPEALNDSQYLVPRMTRDQLLESIEGPIGMGGARIAPRLSQRLLNDAGENPDLLPVLQHLLMRLWEESREAREGGEAIDLQHYENPSVGGMSKALNLDANRAYDAVATDDRRKWMVRRIFQRLVEPGAKNEETRRPTALSELAAVCEAPFSEVETVIQPFRERGFLTLSQDHDPVVDISHESLIRLWDRLGGWVKDEVASAAIYKRLAESAAGKLALYRDPELTQTRNWRESTRPNRAWAERYLDGQAFGEAMHFLERSHTARRWRLWRGIGAIAALAVVLVVFILIFQQRLRDREAMRVAKAGQLTAVASFLVREDLSNAPLSALLALTARKWGATPENLRMLQDLTPLLPKQVTRIENEDQVWSVSFSPDGNLMATGSDDGTVRIFDAHSWKELQHQKYDGGISTVVFSPDSQLLVEGGGDSTARLLNATTGTQVSSFKSDGIILSVAFSPDGRSVGLATGKTRVHVIDPKAGRELPGFEVTEPVQLRRIAFSPDGRWLAAAANDGKFLYLFDAGSKALVFKLEQAGVRDIAFSADSRYIAVARNDSTVRILRFPDEKTTADGGAPRSPDEMATAEGAAPKEASHVELDDAANSVSFSPDGRLVAAGNDGNTAVVFEALSGLQVSQFAAGGAVNAVAFHPSSDFIAIGGTDKATRVFATHSMGLQMIDFADQGTIGDVEFSNDLTLGVASIKNQTAAIFEVPSGRKVLALKDTDQVSTATFSHDKSLLVVGEDTGRVSVFRIADGARIWKVKEGGVIDDTEFNWGDSLIATGSHDKTLRVLDARTGKEKWRATLGDGVNQVIFSRDNRFLACSANDKTARVFEVATGKELARITHSDPVLRLAFNPDSTTLATGTYDKILRIFDGHSGKEILEFPQDALISDIVYSPDGNYIATSTLHHTTHIFDLGKKAELFNSKFPYNVDTVQFSQDGRTLLSAGAFDVNANGPNPASSRVWFYMQPVLSSDLMNQTCSLLTANLSPSQWKQYLGNEPYQKTCPNLPVPRETAAAK